MIVDVGDGGDGGDDDDDENEIFSVVETEERSDAKLPTSAVHSGNQLQLVLSLLYNREAHLYLCILIELEILVLVTF